MGLQAAQHAWGDEALDFTAEQGDLTHQGAGDALVDVQGIEKHRFHLRGQVPVPFFGNLKVLPFMRIYESLFLKSIAMLDILK